MIGNQSVWNFLKMSLKAGRFSHAYLFSGVEALGKFSLAREFANLVLCHESEKCGKCSNCSQFLKSQHPDYMELQPVDGVISIKELRSAQNFLKFKPYHAQSKFLIINDAHCLTPEAQNALLKTLEEPTPDSIIFLITSNKFSLYPTILSRVQVLDFKPVAKTEIAEWLNQQCGLTDKKARYFAKLSQGCPGIAFRLATSSEFQNQKDEIVQDFLRVAQGNFVDFFAKIKGLEREKVVEILSVGAAILRDALFCKFNLIDLVVHDDYIEDIKKISQKWDLKQLLKNLVSLDSAGRTVEEYNVNDKLYLEGALIQLS